METIELQAKAGGSKGLGSGDFGSKFGSGGFALGGEGVKGENGGVGVVLEVKELGGNGLVSNSGGLGLGVKDEIGGGGVVLTPQNQTPCAPATKLKGFDVNIARDLNNLGLRDKALAALGEALEAEKQGWEGARDPDHYARLKAVDMIINRTDGKVVDRSEIVSINATLTGAELNRIRLPQNQLNSLSTSLGDKLGAELADGASAKT